MLGQLNGAASVNAVVQERESTAIERITSEDMRTAHALVALAHAPISTCAWWAGMATAPSADNTLALAAARRIVGELPASNAALGSLLTTGLYEVIPYLDEADVVEISELLAGVLLDLPWSSAEETDETRKVVYAVGRSLISTNVAPGMRASLIADVIEGFNSYYTADTLAQAMAHVQKMDTDTARNLDTAFDRREPGVGEEVGVVKLRLAARRVGGLPALPVALMQIAVPLAESKDSIVGEWLGMQPSLTDVISILQSLCRAEGSNRQVYDT